MNTKAMVLVVAMGAAGTTPVDAQIGDRNGRASGAVAQDRRIGDDHCWDGSRSRDRRCEDRGRIGQASGSNGRYDTRDGRRDDRIGSRGDDRSGNVRAHDQLHGRLDRMHADWHRRHGWNARNARWRRDHDELHRRLRRVHDDWHRDDRRRDGRRDGPVIRWPWGD